MRVLRDWYGRRMIEWENRLAFRTNNRVVRPFEWGLEWVERWPVAQRLPRNGHDPERYFRILNREAVANSDNFFSYQQPHDFRLEGDMLRFTSAVETPYAENNVVHARWFVPKANPARRGGRAVLVLPHWNASFGQHAALCRGLARLGIPALRLSLPYHDFRMPAELHRADYAVSANIGRTIDATRQAVIDARSCLDWLEQQGYEHLAIVGTSLGSCYAFLTSTHDSRLRVNVFNHCSTYFADVVWTGLSTQHIRTGMETDIDLDRLRETWMVISPMSYMDRYAKQDKKSAFIWATYDTTFLPELSRKTVNEVRRRNMDARIIELPCGHYTLGETPFKFIDGYQICSFLLKNL
jgi:Alpha/beta hydrolase domain containing 18